MAAMLEITGMRYVDLGVILAYLALITWFGARFRRNQKSLRDYNYSMVITSVRLKYEQFQLVSYLPSIAFGFLDGKRLI